MRDGLAAASVPGEPLGAPLVCPPLRAVAGQRVLPMRASSRGRALRWPVDEDGGEHAKEEAADRAEGEGDCIHGASVA